MRPSILMEKHKERVQQVEDYRKQHGGSQVEVCKALGIAPSTLSSSKKILGLLQRTYKERHPSPATPKASTIIAAEPIQQEYRSKRLICLIGSPQEIYEVINSL